MTPKDCIVERTMRMFVSHGIRAVRMDDVAQQLGVSKRSLYELFGDKEGLLYQAMVRYFDDSRRRWAEPERRGGQCARTVVHGAGRRHGPVGGDRPADGQSEEALSRRARQVHARRLRPEPRGACVRCSGRGSPTGFFIGSIDIDLAISVLYYTASALVSRRDLLLPEGISERKAFVQIVSTFFRGISTAEGLRLVDAYRARYE